MTLDELVVELKLDPTNFTRGQREAMDAFSKTSEAALKGSKNTPFPRNEAASPEGRRRGSTGGGHQIEIFSAVLTRCRREPSLKTKPQRSRKWASTRSAREGRPRLKC